MKAVVAHAEVSIAAPPDRVWQAMTDPLAVSEYFLGATVDTDWQPGSTITWRGEWQGKPFEDKGKIVQAEPPHRLVLTHFSPMTGQSDLPENYHTISYELTAAGDQTHVSLDQDNNRDEAEAAHASSNWESMLQDLKKIVERTT